MQIEKLIQKIRPLDETFLKQAQARTASLVMPPRALGRLHDISERLCAILQTLEPNIDSKAFLVMAGDHGVAEEKVSAFPQEVTFQMVRTFLCDGAAISALARQVNAEVWVVDMGVIPDLEGTSFKNRQRLLVHKIARGTANIAKGPAMTRAQAEQAVLTGFTLASQLFDQGVTLLGTGDMGIANTTPSAAIGSILTGESVETMTGRGTGVDDAAYQNKCAVVKRSLEVNQPNPADGLDVLSKVGGFEIGGIAGAVLAAAYHRRPVCIDGFISTAGALIAHAICPTVKDFLFAAHCSAERGHRAMLKHLGLEPLLDLGMRLGEGSGAAVAMHLFDSATAMFREVFTFDQAEVSKGS